MKNQIYTIGHSDLDLDAFIMLLKKYKVQVLIDVRSQPYSSYVKHFNKEALKASLQKHKIDYYYGGAYLGGRPTDECLFHDGKLDYKLVRKSEGYKKGMQVLNKLAMLKSVVIMCSEEDPGRCHRQYLIAPDLIKMGYEIRNIRSDGSYEVLDKKPEQLLIEIENKMKEECPDTNLKPENEINSDTDIKPSTSSI